MNRVIWIANEEQPVSHVVQGAARGLKTFREREENIIQVIPLSEAMFAGDAILCAPDLLVITQAGKTAAFRAGADAVGKHAGQEKRMVSDVEAKLETRAVIGRLQRRDHLEEVIEWIVLTRKDTA